MNQHLERLDGLAPFLHKPALRLIERSEKQLGRKLLVVRTWSSVQEQMLKYQQGRMLNREMDVWEVTDQRLVITDAKPGMSGHNVITKTGGRAAVCLDVIPLRPDGTAEWDVDGAFWDKLWEIGWKVGLDPLGDQIGSYLAGDNGHFEEPGYTWKLDGLGLMLPTNILTTVS
jgi:hypothetical protein